MLQNLNGLVHIINYATCSNAANKNTGHKNEQRVIDDDRDEYFAARRQTVDMPSTTTRMKWTVHCTRLRLHVKQVAPRGPQPLPKPTTNPEHTLIFLPHYGWTHFIWDTSFCIWEQSPNIFQIKFLNKQIISNYQSYHTTCTCRRICREC